MAQLILDIITFCFDVLTLGSDVRRFRKGMSSSKNSEWEYPFLPAHRFLCRRDGIGRHKGLKILCLGAYRFKSGRAAPLQNERVDAHTAWYLRLIIANVVLCAVFYPAALEIHKWRGLRLSCILHKIRIVHLVPGDRSQTESLRGESIGSRTTPALEIVTHGLNIPAIAYARDINAISFSTLFLHSITCLSF